MATKNKEIVGLLNKEMDSLVDDYAKKRIADLEAKLAESKEFLMATKWKVEDLEKQIAEKDKELETYKKALTLAREYMFNVMCADDVPSENWFIESAKNNKDKGREVV